LSEKFVREWTHKSVDEVEGLTKGEENSLVRGVDDKEQEVDSGDEQVAELDQLVVLTYLFVSLKRFHD
jgi:hypothetical protein